jgi:hypothetical protein
MYKIKMTPEDRLFSEYIRKRAILRCGGCERCGAQKFDIQKDNGDVLPAWKQLQCSHFHGRKSQSVRYDPDNAFGLCASCHMYFTANPHEHAEFVKSKIGENRMYWLQIRKEKVKEVDKAAVRIYLKQLLSGQE